MKTALYFKDGYAQIVLTPESDLEKAIVNNVKIRRFVTHRGSFYACVGGYVRQRDPSDDQSLILVPEKEENVCGIPDPL